ncbi:MAG: D-aminoacyl-tRNA deacylase [Candidatus Omnitrophica bacterium]|nr:D-aminoacyl-tRNA deacylase [Candidatus Omnitrophota bacterium]
MKAVIQRVKESKVVVDNETVADIRKGILIFLAVGKGDTEESAIKLAKKISELRIFDDSQGKMNLSIKDVKGEILVVSQFTLYADCWDGRRPSFDPCAEPTEAKMFYDLFIRELAKTGLGVKEGKFAARMEVELINDGPVTFILET